MHFFFFCVIVSLLMLMLEMSRFSCVLYFFYLVLNKLTFLRSQNIEINSTFYVASLENKGELHIQGRILFKEIWYLIEKVGC